MLIVEEITERPRRDTDGSEKVDGKEQQGTVWVRCRVLIIAHVRK